MQRDSEHPIKVILADDHDLMREGIARLLSESSGVQLVAEANSFRKLKVLVESYHPDVVVTDLHMRDEKTFTLSQMKTFLHGCPLVAISLWNDEQTKALAMSIGAAKLLDKANLVSDLIPTIQQCAAKVTLPLAVNIRRQLASRSRNKSA